MGLYTYRKTRSLRPDTVAFIDRMAASPGSAFEGAYDRIYRRTKKIVPKLAGFYCLAAQNADQVTLNMAADNSMTAGNASALILYPGEHTDISGGNGFYDTGIAASSLSANNCCFGVYLTDHEGGDSDPLIGHAGSSDRFRLAVTDTSVAGRIVDSTTQVAAHSGNDTGLFAAVRDSATTSRFVRNGTTLGSFTDTVDTLPGTNITIFRNNTAYAYSKLAFAFFGQALTDAEYQTLTDAMEAFLDEVTPRHYLITGFGQSNYERLDIDSSTTGSGDGTAESAVLPSIMVPIIQTGLDSTYNDGRVNRITTQVAPVMKGGTFLLRQDDDGTKADEDSWVDNTGASFDTAYRLEQAETILEGLAIAPAQWDRIAVLCTHEGQGDTTDPAFSNTRAEWKAAWPWEIEYANANIFGRNDPVYILRCNGGMSDIDPRQRSYRLAQGEVVSEYSGTATFVLDNESWDAQRIAADDFHPVSKATSDQGYELLGRRLANVILRQWGCPVSAWRGPEIASATAVNSTTIDVTINYGEGCGGTDFTPTTGIVGFEVEDSSGSKAVSAAVRQDANTIRLTVAALASGSVTVTYIPIAGALDYTKMVRDNHTPPFPLRYGVATFNYST